MTRLSSEWKLFRRIIMEFLCIIMHPCIIRIDHNYVAGFALCIVGYRFFFLSFLLICYGDVIFTCASITEDISTYASAIFVSFSFVSLNCGYNYCCLFSVNFHLTDRNVFESF